MTTDLFNGILIGKKQLTSDNKNFALNFLGAFECACPRGFRQMGDRCVDVDECVEQQGEQNSHQFRSEKQLTSANNIFLF